ncbi:MAG: dihydroorotase [Flavobacteriaceae bacterium]
MNILFKNAKIIDKNSPFHLQTKDILIEKGIITKIDKNLKATKDTKLIDLENLHISNGWFDTSVSLGEPGYEERETIENGLKTAANSGFTAIAMNPNTFPVIDNKSAVEFIVNKTHKNIVDVYPIANFSKEGKGENMAELYDMKNSGAIAFGDYNSSIKNVNLFKIGLQYVQNFEGLLINFPQDNSFKGFVNEGENSTKIGLKGMPSLAEELQIARDLFVLEYTGGKLHIPSISTKKSVKLISDAKKKGLNVTCSVTAHHLVLTDDEILNFNTNCKVLPPLRTKSDIKALQNAVKNGVIDAITSDHNPIDIEHKKVAFENAKYGTIGLESLFGAINSVLDLETTITALTFSPRKVFGLEQSTIDINEKANLTFFDPECNFDFTEDLISSTSKNALFLNKKLKGKVYGIYNAKKLHLHS